MPKVSPIQNVFTVGEVSPIFLGRVDADRYQQSLKTCKNLIPTLQGPVFRRSGTKFIFEAAAAESQLIRFEFSKTQAYILEFYEESIRVFKDYGVVLDPVNPLVPYEIETPYQAADIADINFVQSADVLYLFHPDYPTAKLLRFGDDSWSYRVIEFNDGPYLDVNATDYTLTPGAATGTTSLTAGPAKSVTGAVAAVNGEVQIQATGHGYESGDRVTITGVTGTTEANGSFTVTKVDADNFSLNGTTFVNAYVSGGSVRPGIFFSTDVGRLVRVKLGTNAWGFAKITAFTSFAVVTIAVESTFTDNTGATATKIWRLGAISDTTGYPGTGAFHEDRLFISGIPGAPQQIFGSRTSDYENFEPTALDSSATVAATNSLSFNFNSNDVNYVEWLASDERALLAGTTAGEWVTRSSSNIEALTPTSISAKRASTIGSANVAPMQAAKSVVFVQRSGNKVRELSYFFDVDGFRTTDLTLLAEHLPRPGMVRLAYQKEPIPIIWAVKADGNLIGMVYDRDVENLRAGWHRHELGGYGTANLDPPKVLSISTIPSPDTSREDLWLVVQRFINNQVIYYIEVMDKNFTNSVDQQDAFFVDSGLVYDVPLTYTSLNIGIPGAVVFSKTAHGLSVGDQLKFYDVGRAPFLKNRICTVSSVIDVDNLELSVSDFNADENGIYSGGTYRNLVSNISGLSHLEGETVQILTDGAPHPVKQVVAGAITLDEPAAVVAVGLGFISDGEIPRINAGAADGTSLGKTQRINRVGMLFYRTLGVKVGPNFNELSDVTFSTDVIPLGHPPELFSGTVSVPFEAQYNFDNTVCFRQDQPLPLMLLSVMPQMHTQDR